MLTIEKLRAYGANVDEGLGRCMNNEAFYLRLVNMAVGDAGFERLHTALKQGDRKEGFEAAHALKGMQGNHSLTPLSKPLNDTIMPQTVPSSPTIGAMTAISIRYCNRCHSMPAWRPPSSSIASRRTTCSATWPSSHCSNAAPMIFAAHEPLFKQRSRNPSRSPSSAASCASMMNERGYSVPCRMDSR